MFTGLITDRGTITGIAQQGDRAIQIAPASGAAFPRALGASIACNGICLTVTHTDATHFTVQLSAETLRCTTAQHWRVGGMLNLEPSLAVGDRLGGHFVSGHVDGVARVVAIEPSGESSVWTFALPDTLARFIAPKGSVTIDGVSLTVNQVKAEELNNWRTEELEKTTSSVPPFLSSSVHTTFTVTIIPHTAAVTGFGALRVGDTVNLEVDVLARYVARLAECV